MVHVNIYYEDLEGSDTLVLHKSGYTAIAFLKRGSNDTEIQVAIWAANKGQLVSILKGAIAKLEGV